MSGCQFISTAFTAWNWLISIHFGFYFRFARYRRSAFVVVVYKNKLLAKETDRYCSKQIIEGCEKALSASEFKTDWSVHIFFCFNFIFLAHCFLTSKNSGGAQAPPAPPLATGLCLEGAHACDVVLISLCTWKEKINYYMRKRETENISCNNEDKINGKKREKIRTNETDHGTT